MGSFEDFKERKVSNYITWSIISVSIPLVYLNFPQISWFHLLFISMLVILHAAGKFGPADIKAMIPLILLFSLVQFLMFISVSLLAGGFISIKYGKNIPFVPAILVGFIVAVVLV